MTEKRVINGLCSLFLVPKLQFGNTYPQSSALLRVIVEFLPTWSANFTDFRRSEAGASEDMSTQAKA